MDEAAARKWPFFEEMKSISNGVWPPRAADDDERNGPAGSGYDETQDWIEDLPEEVPQITEIPPASDVPQIPEIPPASDVPQIPEIPMAREREERVSKKKDPLLEALIEEYSEMRERFEEEADTHAVYRDLAEIMCIRGFHVTADDCKKKFNALTVVFRRIYDMSGKNKDSLASTGNGANTWPYYEEMLKLYQGDVTITPPVALAAGSAAILRRDAPREDYLRTSKERPSSAVRSEKERLRDRLLAPVRPFLAGTAGAKKQADLELKERRVAAEERFVDEFSAYRRTLEERSKQNAEFVRMLEESRAEKSKN